MTLLTRLAISPYPHVWSGWSQARYCVRTTPNGTRQKRSCLQDGQRTGSPRAAGRRSQKEVVASCGRCPEAYRQQSAIRFASAMVWMESISPHPRGMRPVRLGNAFRVKHPNPSTRMVMHAHRPGHIKDVALVRSREAWSWCRTDRRDRIAQRLSGTGAGEHDRHVLPAGAHRRSVNDITAERIAWLHALGIEILDKPGCHFLRTLPGDLGNGIAMTHRRCIHIDRCGPRFP